MSGPRPISVDVRGVERKEGWGPAITDGTEVMAQFMVSDLTVGCVVRSTTRRFWFRATYTGVVLGTVGTVYVELAIVVFSVS